MRNILIVLLLFPFMAYGQGWQWGRGNTGGGMDSWAVATDPSGNVYAAGFRFPTQDTGVGPLVVLSSYTVPFTSTMDYQTIISKYDANGTFLWAKGTQDGGAIPINIATDQLGNSFLFGAIWSQSVKIDSVTLTNTIYPETQYFLVKFDPSGNVLWAISAGNSVGAGITVGGHTYVLGGGGIGTDVMGNVYITTNFNLPTITIGPYTLTNADLSRNTDDVLVAKYDQSGNVVWASSCGGSNNDDAFGLTVTPAGNIYIAGAFSSPSMAFGPSTILNKSDSLDNAFIAEFNSSGTPVWASGSGGKGGECAVGVASDASNNVYLTGGLSDSNIAFGGTTISNPYPGNSVLYLVKFSSSHNVIWYKTIGDSTGVDVSGYCIAMSPCGAVWVSGSFVNYSGLINDKINVDGHILTAPTGSTDPVFIAGFSTTGEYAGSACLQSGADDQNGIACDALGNVYMCADYISIPFTVGNDTLEDINFATSTSFEVEWQYVAKYAFVNVSNPDTFYAHRDTTVCTSAELTLSAPVGYSSYLWENGNTGTTMPINSAGTYWVVGKGGCTIIDSITVIDSTSLCGCKVSLPNAFTPNNDGKDDYFYPIFLSDCIVANYAFEIYNRWGQQVFYSEDPTAKWNGTFEGVKADLGTYMYYLKYNSGPTNAAHATKGDVTLIR